MIGYVVAGILIGVSFTFLTLCIFAARAYDKGQIDGYEQGKRDGFNLGRGLLD